MFGARTKDEMLTSLERVFVPETMDVFREELIAVAEGARHFEAETVVQTLQGKRLNVLFAIAYPEHEQEFTHVLVTLVDITDRKRAEDALQEAQEQLEQRVEDRTTELVTANAALKTEIAARRKTHEAQEKSEQRMRQLLETTRAIPWTADAKTFQFTYIGPQAAHVLGYATDQWYKDNFWPDHIHAHDRQEAVDYCLHAPQSADAYEFEYRMIAADGRIVWIQDLVSVVRENGEPTVIQGFMIDITEHKQNEITIRDSGARLAGIIDIASDALISVDEDQQILLFNKGAEAIFGYAADEILGQPLDVLIPERFHAVHRGHVAAFGGSATSARRMGERQTLRGRRKNGEEFPIEAGISKLATETTRLFTVILRDVTERERAEETLRQQRDELAHVQRAATMGELTAALAHQINQPLAAIRGNAQAAKRLMENGEPDLDEIGEILDDIITDNRRAAEIIISLRGLLKKHTVATEPLSINAVVGEITGLLHSDAVIKNVSIQLDLAEELPPVSGDRVQLQQVLLNLIVNGFEAMDDVPVAERTLLIQTAQADASSVRVSVRDVGIGFDAQDVETLFRPFWTTKTQGLGMGLAIGRTIVEAHGGTLWAESSADRGATFSFTLPVGASD